MHGPWQVLRESQAHLAQQEAEAEAWAKRDAEEEAKKMILKVDACHVGPHLQNLLFGLLLGVAFGLSLRN